jgi:Zn-dependent protease
MQVLDIIFYVLILLFSIVIHEVSHGLMARKLGDKTAEHEGRLTLNPISHIDPLGSIILPLLLVISHSPFLIGWAKPVPYNPYNFFDKPWIRKWGEALVAFAGPLSNITILIAFGLFLRFFTQIVAVLPFLSFFTPAVSLISTIVLVNIVLAVFNLVPIPPLDGSKILFAILPHSMYEVREFLERYSLFLSLFFIFFLWQYLSPLITFFYYLVVGI